MIKTAEGIKRFGKFLKIL